MNEMMIDPSSSSSSEDFNFCYGKWRIANRKLLRRFVNCNEWSEFEATSDCSRILRGIGNAESYFTDAFGSPFEGYALRLFDPTTRLWSIFWTDSERATLDPPQIGSFANGVGEFLARDVFEGKPIIVKFRWDATDPDRPIWSQAFSADDGATWEWNWFMKMERENNE